MSEDDGLEGNCFTVEIYRAIWSKNETGKRCIHLNKALFMRFLGICSVITGILFLSMIIWASTSLDEFGSFVTLIGMVLLVFGLLGFYLRQMNEFGVFGFIVFVITMVGTVLWAGFMWVNAFVVPVLQERAPELVKGGPPGLANVGLQTSLYIFFIGLFLFGILTAIKGVLPRLAAILLILVPILNFIPYADVVSQPLAGISFIWLGISVWKGVYEESQDVS